MGEERERDARCTCGVFLRLAVLPLSALAIAAAAAAPSSPASAACARAASTSACVSHSPPARRPGRASDEARASPE